LLWFALGGVLVLGILGIGAVFGVMAYLSAEREVSAARETVAERTVELDGVGAETVGRRLAPRGWKVSGEPVLNLEGTHQMHIITIQRGETFGVVTIYDFVDTSGAERHAQELGKQGLAVVRDGDLILSVEVRGNAAEATALLELISKG
jgi:hypothetical protein